ncbi:MAG: alpha/beta fold hydrolase [Chitinophagales bacterium]|nr:lysophospholipase [Chitinophagales bacterium]MDW8274309.1 alpha/beta fold hydrolase [Chitinophagales bacterium]
MFYVNGKAFKTLDDYFLYISETLGYPHELKDYFISDVTFSDGLKLHLDIYEYAKEAPTVVFMPGTSLYALCYAEFMWKLGESGFNVIGFDPRGHGRSEGQRGDYTVEELMRDAESVITWAIQRYNDNVSFMGSSQGGIIAFYMAAKDERLKGVTCQNFADLTDPDTVKLTKYPALFSFLKSVITKAGEIAPNIQIPVNRYIDLEKIPVRYFGNAKNFIETDPITLKSISLRALRSLATTPLPKRIEDITVPVMVFQGDADSIFPVSYTRKIFERINSKKKISIFPGMTHALMHENVDEILPEIVSWLREIHPKKSQAITQANLQQGLNQDN